METKELDKNLEQISESTKDPLDQRKLLEFVTSIEKFIKQKWYCEIKHKVKRGIKFKYGTLIDSDVDVNYIREGITLLGTLKSQPMKFTKLMGENLE